LEQNLELKLKPITLWKIAYFSEKNLPGFFEKNWSHFDRLCSFGEFDANCPRFGPAASGGFQV
jgi:hypothetical protein